MGTHILPLSASFIVIDGYFSHASQNHNLISKQNFFEI